MGMEYDDYLRDQAQQYRELAEKTDLLQGLQELGWADISGRDGAVDLKVTDHAFYPIAYAVEPFVVLDRRRAV
jgi:hypothetical protein